MATSSLVVSAMLISGVAWAIWDIQASERETLVIYTTPALRDVIEKDVVPAFHERTGVRVSLVYVAAGQQYNRLRMSGETPEADLFLHASPLYLEKGHADGFVDPSLVPEAASLDAAFTSRPTEGGHAWYAFAWSPLVEVYSPGTGATPDLATSRDEFGFPHPILSNNGVWTVLYFEHVDPSVGAEVLARTRVQPTNARANIGGVADGSFGLTLGYEAVVRFYQEQGARVAYDVPLVNGERVTTRVLFSAALIHNEDRHPAAEAFVRFLFTPEAQDAVGRHHFRPVLPDAEPPEDVLDLSAATIFAYDWSQWQALEAALPRYEVRS